MSDRWYRSTVTGERGRLTTQEGRAFVKLDNPSQVQLRPIGPEWVEETEARPLQRAAVAQVAFAADVALCTALGITVRKKLWHELSQEEKKQWLILPPLNPARRVLYRAIEEALKGLCQ